MVGVHLVELAAGVAGVGRGAEVGVGQPEVGLIRNLVGPAGGEGERLEDGGARGRRQPDAAEGVGLVEPRRERVAARAGQRQAVGALDGLEPVHVVAPDLGHEPDPQPAQPTGGRRGRAHAGVERPLVVGAEQDLAPGLRPAGHVGRDQVEGAARGGRPVLDLARAGPDLDAVHPPDRWEVVRRGRGVGRRRDEHAVLHQRDRARPLGPAPAQADVGAEPVAVLLLDRHARHLAQHAVHVVAADQLECSGVDVVARPGQVQRPPPRQRLARGHDHLVERDLGQHQPHLGREPVPHRGGHPRRPVAHPAGGDGHRARRQPRDLEPAVGVGGRAALGPLDYDVGPDDGVAVCVEDDPGDAASLCAGGEGEQGEEREADEHETALFGRDPK